MPLNKKFRPMLLSIWIVSAETLLGVAVVAVLSLALLGALFVMFPRGSGLVDVYRGGVTGERAGTESRPGFVDELTQPIAATLTHVTRQVKDRPADAVVWNRARRGMAVHHQHAIQTFARSAATISIEGRDAIRLDENSLIVFRQPERGHRGERRRATIALLGGEIHGSLPAAAGSAAFVDIVTANASTRFAGAGSDPASYSISVGADNSSTIKLFSGSAEITTGDDRTVLEANEAVTVSPDRTIGAPVQVAPAPRTIAPAEASTVLYGSVVPRVLFRWDSVAGVSAYRLVIARDAGLEAVVYDAIHEDEMFEHGALEPGTYYWRVSAIRADLEGLPSDVRTVELSRDAEPPRLDVELVALTTGELTVRGTTEPGAVVYIGETSLNASETGEFTHVVSLERGVNMIVVEAVDAVGNSSYYSEYVDENGRPRRSP